MNLTNSTENKLKAPKAVSDITFAPAITAFTGSFTVGSTWSNFDKYPRQVGDVNGDLEEISPKARGSR